MRIYLAIVVIAVISRLSNHCFGEEPNSSVRPSNSLEPTLVKTDDSAQEKRSTRKEGTFTGGGTVQVLGVCSNYHVQDEEWWSADGKRCAALAKGNTWSTRYPYPLGRQLHCLLKIYPQKMIEDQIFEFRVGDTNVYSSFSYSVTEVDSSVYSKGAGYILAEVNVGEGMNEFDMECLGTGEEWKDIGSARHNASEVEGADLLSLTFVRDNDCIYTISHPTEDCMFRLKYTYANGLDDFSQRLTRTRRKNPFQILELHTMYFGRLERDRIFGNEEGADSFRLERIKRSHATIRRIPAKCVD
ncbi:MAG: hypothetical protein FJ267_06655 [Planctomycetes bacterium]|nr:hypothetical protein [Planctomycetota bacterium]